MASPRRNRNFALNLAAIALGMGMLAYASVPLYRVFCQATGFGGQARPASHLTKITSTRRMEVRFDANVAPALGWHFAPTVRSVEVRLGEERHIDYLAQNISARPRTGTATFNVTPVKAGRYFNKIACFCFSEQTLKPGETKTLGVMFFLDPALENDPDLKDVHTITLSYTFFPLQGK